MYCSATLGTCLSEQCIILPYLLCEKHQKLAIAFVGAI
jgi:hypothetical protein